VQVVQPRLNHRKLHMFRLSRSLHVSRLPRPTPPRCRPIAFSYSKSTEDSASDPPDGNADSDIIYRGPLAATYKNLKIFSLSSLALTATFTPLIFMMESSVPPSARFALAGVTLLAGGSSTAVIAWCGKPYVSVLRKLGTQGLEMTTTTMFLQPLTTRVYDVNFLIDSKRPFAKWELAETIKLPPSKVVESSPREETIAETFDANGNVLGMWIVKWDGEGNGTCRQVGKVVRSVAALLQICASI
jgi:hypothetical protein